MRRLLLVSSLLLLLSACTPDQAPEETRRPDPQAAGAPAAAPAGSASPITATANGYKDAARNAVNQTQDAAAREQSQIDQAGQ